MARNDVDELEAEVFKRLDEKEARRSCREKLGITKERHFMHSVPERSRHLPSKASRIAPCAAAAASIIALSR